METKICTKCKIKKEINKFKKFKSTNGKYYYSGVCKQCRNLEALERNRNYRNSHKKEIAIMKKKNYQKNKENIMKKNKKYYEEHKEQIKSYSRQYYQNNKQKVSQARKQYYELKKKGILKEKYEYKKERLKNDEVFRIREQTRNMIRTSFRKKGISKSERTEEILKCTLDFFYKYLLQTFKNNYGYEWDGKEKVHIDHIIPLSTAKSEEEVIKLCHYSNLQLLKAEDNLKKNDKLNWSIRKER